MQHFVRSFIVATFIAAVLVPAAVSAQSQTFIDQGTLTADTPAISTTATWNSSGTYFSHLNVAITDTTSNSQSSLFDFRVNGVMKAHLSKGGWLSAGGFSQNINGVQRFFTQSDGIAAGWANQDYGNDVAGPTLFIGNNNNASNPNPGTLQLVSGNSGHYYVWPSTAGDLRIHFAPPGGAVSDTAGTVIGTQTSSRDAKNIEGTYTDYRGALDTILSTNLYSFTYKKTDFPEQKFVGLVTDESPVFGQYADETHPNGRSLNVVNSIGYLMAAIKAQQAEIETLRRQVAELTK